MKYLMFTVFLFMFKAYGAPFNNTDWVKNIGCYKTLTLNGFPVPESHKLGYLSIEEHPYIREIRGTTMKSLTFLIYEKTVGSTHHFQSIDVPLWLGEYSQGSDSFDYKLNSEVRFEDWTVGKANVLFQIKKLHGNKISIRWQGAFDYFKENRNQLI